MSEPTSVRSLITPQDQTLRSVFGAQRAYFMDIYQREYKWTEDNVRALLNDIEMRFNQQPRLKNVPKEIQEDILGRFEPYFLNTYLTSTTSANTSIVDGQQRLTTLLLILIKLYRLLKKLEDDPKNKERTYSSKTIELLVFETNDFGTAERFKIFNENREDAFKSLANGQTISAEDQTRTRIAANYEKVIDPYFETLFKDSNTGGYDLVMITYYLTYLLDRVSIVEIRIERQENVAMIFEVVNDRGLGLQPYEILKGKLIGGLRDKKKELANAVWTDLQERYFQTTLKNATDKIITLDQFFQTFFRAKFADSESEYEKFEGDYHYEMYRNERIKQYFGNFQDRDLLFDRITKDIKFFADLYLRLRTGYECEPLVYNKLLDQNQQYLLILSAVSLNDSDCARKVEKIAGKFDQLHTVLRLLDAYDQSFQRLIYPLTNKVRDRNLDELDVFFDEVLLSKLVSENVIKEGICTNAKEVFEFDRFKGIRNQWTNFSKYILMRIDRHLAALLDKPSYAGEGLEELEDRFNKNNLRRYGMHLEHVYTQHDSNRALFMKDGTFDESDFQQKRNLLGMVLLLKDKQNLSSNNEVYVDKQVTYSTSNLIWNELLVGHIPNVDLGHLPKELRVEPVRPENRVFPLSAIDARQRVTFEAIKHIWGQL